MPSNGPPNQNPKGPPNQTLSGVASSATPGEFARAISGAGRSMNTLSYGLETERQKRLIQEQEKIAGTNEWIAAQAAYAAGTAVHPGSAKEVNRLERQYEKLGEGLLRSEQKQNLMFGSSVMKGFSVAETAVNRSFSSSTINGEVQGSLGQIGIRQAGLKIAQDMSPSMVTQRKAELQNTLGTQETGIRDLLAGPLRDPKTRAAALGQANELFQQRAGSIKELGEISSAEKTYKAQGRGVDAWSESAAKAQQVQKGDPLYASANKLLEAFNALASATDKSAGNLKKLDDNLEKATGQFNKEAGGGGGMSRMQKISAAIGGFGQLAGAYNEIQVNQRLGQVYNAAGAANWENQKYQTYKAAAGGDIASLMRLSEFGKAEALGDDISTSAKRAQIAKGAVGLAQTGFGGLELLNPLQDATTTGESGINNVIGGAASTAVAGADVARRVSELQARQAARNARLDVSNAVNAVGAEQVQGFRDYAVGMGSAAMGMGTAGEGFLNRMNDKGNNLIQLPMLQRMANARISPEQMAKMAQFGVANMGSMFNEEQVFASRGMESRGFGSMQEGMQRMAALSAAGANNPQASMAVLLEGAVSKGVANAKNLNLIAEHTGNLAAASIGRGMGLDTTAAASAVLMAGITKNTPNAEAALARSAGLQERINAQSGNVDVSFAGMVNTATAGKLTGLGGVSAIAGTKLDPATLKTLQGIKDPNQLAKEMAFSGIDVSGKDPQKVLEGLVRSKELALIRGPNAALMTANPEEIRQKAEAATTLDKFKKSLTNKEALSLGQEQISGGLGVEGIFLGTKGLATDVPNGDKGKGLFGIPGDEDKSALSKADKLRTSGFEQMSVAAKAGADAFGGAADAVNKLTTAIGDLMKRAPDIEKSSTGAAGKAANDAMSVDVAALGATIKDLDKVLQKAIIRGGGTPTSADKQKVIPPGT